jgi:hypothetical protein
MVVPVGFDPTFFTYRVKALATRRRDIEFGFRGSLRIDHQASRKTLLCDLSYSKLGAS